jgi:hypothetical protein
LLSGISARKNEKKRPAWASLTLSGVCGIILNLLELLNDLFHFSYWELPFIRHILVGVLGGILLSMWVSGQFKCLKKDRTLKEPSNK